MKPPTRIHKTVVLSVTLAALWLVLSGHYNAFMLALGAGSVALCVWLAQRMGVFDEEVHPAHFRLLPLVRYWVWLLDQIVRSALDVARRVLDPSLPIDPVVITLPVAQSTEMGRTTYANSITLTPGTVCLDVDEDTLRVHALTGEGASALREGEMNRRVAALEQGD
jgi:multicomponent Na+:H+ antiporter subunit E